jgi:hypothetical protein
LGFWKRERESERERGRERDREREREHHGRKRLGPFRRREQSVQVRPLAKHHRRCGHGHLSLYQKRILK